MKRLSGDEVQVLARKMVDTYGCMLSTGLPLSRSSTSLTSVKSSGLLSRGTQRILPPPAAGTSVLLVAAIVILEGFG